MVSKKGQSKAGIPVRRRGQQMGDETSPRDKGLEAEENTPALRGRRKEANKYFADDSSQAIGSGAEARGDNAPSVPAAIPTGTKLGESGGEKVFKDKQKAATKRKTGARGDKR